MALTKDDIRFFRSKIVADVDSNGGVMDATSEIISNIKYNLFPRVSYLERINGVTRFRKMFVANTNEDGEVAYNALIALLKPTNGDDVLLIKAGDYNDTQADINDSGWRGCGRLSRDANAANNKIYATFDTTDVYFEPGDFIFVGEYNPSATNEDELFSNVQLLQLLNSEQQILIGTALAGETVYNKEFAGSGVVMQKGTVNISYTIEGQTYVVVDDGQGGIAGPNITSGYIDYSSSINITFAKEPDAGTDIVATYKQQPYLWNGNEVELYLQEGLPVRFSAAKEVYVGVALNLGDLKPSLENVQVMTASGIFDETQVTLNNRGTVYDTWMLSFTSATNFTVSGTLSGALQNGVIFSEYSPINEKTGKPYFTIPTSCWSGAWQTGDKIVLETRPAAKAVWWKQIVPAGANREPYNLAIARVSVE